MSIASNFNALDRRRLLWPHDVWPDVFKDALSDNPELASALAHLIFNMLEAAAKGEKEIEKLCNTLKDGIEWIYPFTGAHQAAFKAYILKLERKMAVEDDPEALMNRAIARALTNGKRRVCE
jgi:hypothetical protein